MELDMLLITKPTANSIERENVTIAVPFTKSFEAVKCVVWFDGEYRGGREGKCYVTLTRNGETTGELGMRVERGHKHSGRLGIL